MDSTHSTDQIKKSKNKSVLYLSVFVLLLVALIMIGKLQVGKPDFYEEAKVFYSDSNFIAASTSLKKVEEGNSQYDSAQHLLFKINIVLAKNRKKEKALNLKNEIANLKSELSSIKTYRISKHGDNLTSLTIGIAILSTWGKMARNAKQSGNATKIKLGKQMDYALKITQVREFPKARKLYGKLVKQKMWEYNIDVKVRGSKSTTLEFIGGTFASNSNIKDFHVEISQVVKDFRFKRVNYKWYKYDDEYTYLNVESERDNKIIIY